MISIILPTHNGSKYIARAIDSVLAQTFSDWELIIVNDASTDNTADIINSYLRLNPKIVFLKNERNLGAVGSLNVGIGVARGEYIARIDDDDEWISVHKLQKQYDFLKHNSEFVIVGTCGIVVNNLREKIVDYKLQCEDRYIRDTILFKNPFIHSSVVFRKEIAIKVGGYYKQIDRNNAEDYDLWLKLGLLGKMANLKEPMVAYTSREGSTSFRFKKDIFQNNLILIRKYRNIYPNYYFAICATYVKYFVYLFLGLLGNTKFRYKVYVFFYTNYLKFSSR